MARRTRTAKKLTQRIDINYFKRSSPLRRLRFALSLLLFLAVIAWMAVVVAHGKRTAFTPGPLAEPHADFEQKCYLCHVPQGNAFSFLSSLHSFHTLHSFSFHSLDSLRYYRTVVTNDACLTCHDGPEHNDAIGVGQCTDCHIEHHGRPASLVAVSDSTCESCHAGHDFFRSHPEFKTSSARTLGTIKMSHQMHAGLGLSCDHCHEPGEPKLVDVSAGDSASRPVRRSNRSLGYIGLVKYAKGCAGSDCHDQNFAVGAPFNDTAPHDTPEAIDKWFHEKHPGNEAPIQKAEQDLWQNTCTMCHSVKLSPGEFPVIADPAARIEWLISPDSGARNAWFSHDAHRNLDCATCHAGVGDSADNSTLAMPSIQTCRTCHRPGMVESRCFECHVYHDWSQEAPTKKKFQVKQLVSQRKNTGGIFEVLQNSSAVQQPARR